MTRPAGPPSPAATPAPRADTPDSLRPPSADRVGRGAVVSTVVHLGLVGALALGVSWHAEAPTPVSAELWSAVPEVAAPPAAGEPNAAPPPPAPAPAPTPAPPPPPPPPVKVAPPPPPPPPKAAAPSPRDAQIALEREKREKERERERERQERLADEKARAEKLAKEKADKAEKAEQERQAKLKEQREQAEKERRAKAAEAEKRAKAEEAEKAEKRAKAAEAEKRAKAEEAEKAEKRAKAEAQAKAAAEEKRQAELAAKLRQQQMARMMGQVGGATDSPGGNGAPGSTGKGARDSGPSAGYAGRIVARVKPNIVFGDDISGNPMAEIEVRTAPDGTIIGRKVARSSGNADWDQAVLRAVDRTGVLPRDTDGRVPAVIIIGFRPRD